MSRDAYAAWGAEVATFEKAKRLAEKLPEDVYGDADYLPSGRIDETRGLLVVEDSRESTMNDGCVTLPDPDPTWIAAFAALGLKGRWYVWCS